ncbi:MAG: hypothetical protein AMXMBFR80_20460 [Dehalococcoidia bacterium]
MGATTIEPGSEVPVELSLPMGMHSGMDGPHLFRIAIPLQDQSGAAAELEVYFKAMFR